MQAQQRAVIVGGGIMGADIAASLPPAAMPSTPEGGRRKQIA
jgi:hypothetical protein